MKEDNLNLPEKVKGLPKGRRLSMDEYLAFVLENIRIFGVDRSKRRQPVNKRFVL